MPIASTSTMHQRCDHLAEVHPPTLGAEPDSTRTIAEHHTNAAASKRLSQRVRLGDTVVRGL
jgi:hypothetical protein